MTDLRHPAQKTALVTGSASGLGRAIAVRLAQDGWQVALADVNDERNRETLKLVEAAGGEGRIEQLDVAAPEQWQRLIEGLRQDWPNLDLLVNNAGVAGSGHIGHQSLEDWRWVVETNLFGTVHGCHFVIPWMKQNPAGGHIVNIASVAAVMCAPTMGAYNISKAGVVALSETIHAELHTRGIRVTVVCPGFVRTNILEDSRLHCAELLANHARCMDVAILSADDVAEQILRAMRRKKLYLFLPASARRAWWYKRLVPRFYLEQVGRGFRKLFPLDEK